MPPWGMASAALTMSFMNTCWSWSGSAIISHIRGSRSFTIYCAVMKVPESGMPEEAYWESLLDVPLILEQAPPPGRRQVPQAELDLGSGHL